MESKGIYKFQLHSIFETGATPDPLDEILLLLKENYPEVDSNCIIKVHKDVSAIFSGHYPGFRSGTTRYHNLRHTYSVALASMRLFHSLYHEQKFLPVDLVIQGLLSAYFHDSGMLLQTTDTAESGANYTKYHEKRSIGILNTYLEHNGFAEDYKENCATIIKYTSLDSALDSAIADLGELNNRLQLCCHVIGSADILAQMADRYYIESLPLLFQEHRDGGIEEHPSALDLMRNTFSFHEKIIKKRLKETLGNIAPSMRTHFRIRWNIDRDLYEENINLNIEYLQKITKDCSLDLSCWGKYLRRTPPVH